MFARLGFAVAIHVDADIFLADEVLAVGDQPFKKKCMEKMQEIRDSGVTLFYVSHAAGSVRKMCDRVLVLEKGGSASTATSTRASSTSTTTTTTRTADDDRGRVCRRRARRRHLTGRPADRTRHLDSRSACRLEITRL